MSSSRCYTLRNGRGSPNLPGSRKWASTSPAPTSCVIGPERRASTAKPTASTTAECGSGRHSTNSPATTGNVSQRWATPVCPAMIISVATTTRYFLREPMFCRRETMGFDGLEISARILPRTMYIRSAFWTIRDRLNLFFPPGRYTSLTGAV